MVKFDPIPMIKSIRIYLGKLKLNACCSLMKLNWKQNMHVSKFDLIMIIEASCMAFMDETNLKVSTHSSDQIEPKFS